MSTTLSLASLLNDQHAARVAAINALLTDERKAFILLPKSQEQFRCTIEEYVLKVVELANWELPFNIDMKNFPVESKGDAKFFAELDFATLHHRCVNIKGALKLDAKDNIMEDMVPFSRIHAAMAELFTAPCRVVVVRLIGAKLNVLPAPKLLGQLAKGSLILEGGLTVPGEPQSEIDFVVRPIDLVRGIPAVTVAVMCGHLSNFHVVPEGTSPRSLGCSPEDCPALFMDFPMLSAEQALHAFKTVAALEYPKQFALERKDMSAEQTEALLAAISGPSGQPEHELGATSRSMILALLAKMKVSTSEASKALGRLVPLGSRYFVGATGVRYGQITPLAFEQFGGLGFQPLIQAACLTARLCDKDNKDLWDRVTLVGKTFGQFAEVEGALHCAKKSSTGVHLFGGDSHDNEWGAVGCPRNFAEVTGLKSSKQLPANHLGRGVSLVAGAMCGDKDTMDFLGLSEPLTVDNAPETAALIINLIWRRIRAAAEA